MFVLASIVHFKYALFFGHGRHPYLNFVSIYYAWSDESAFVVEIDVVSDKLIG